jgi:hypothetical protein
VQCRTPPGDEEVATALRAMNLLGWIEAEPNDDLPGVEREPIEA